MEEGSHTGSSKVNIKVWVMSRSGYYTFTYSKNRKEYSNPVTNLTKIFSLNLSIKIFSGDTLVH